MKWQILFAVAMREVNIDLIIGEFMKHLKFEKEVAKDTHCVKAPYLKQRKKEKAKTAPLS